jgi:hypothetical protein
MDGIPTDMQALLATKLDARSLLSLLRTCRAFKGMTEAMAREWLLARHGPPVATRWRHLTWEKRLRLDACVMGFDRARCADFTFDGSCVALNVMGPKLLLSDASTRDSPVLVWRFFVRGNSAVEVGIVPDDMPYDHQALHQDPPPQARGPRTVVPTGFYSEKTTGSGMPYVVPILTNSYVEVVATRGAVHIVVEKPRGLATGFVSARGFAVPDVFRMSLEYGNDGGYVRLALTAWANAKFEFVDTPPTAI